MGFLDALRSNSVVKFDTQKAIMTIVVAAVRADGDVSDDEVRRIRAMCALSPIFASNSSEEDLGVLRFADNVVTQLKEEEAISKAAEALRPELRETAFAFACDMILADDICGPAEERFLGSLASKLGISEDVGRSVVTCTMVRNRRPS